MSTREADVAIVGAGTAGCYAGATIAEAGYDVLVLERKTKDEAGHIACGDALKGADEFPDAIPKSKLEPAMTNTEVDHGRFELPEHDSVMEIPVPGELAVIDRLAYGKAIIEAAADAGVEFSYDTVVQDVLQDGSRVTGLKARRKGEPLTVEADITIDGAGALSILQDKADFSNSTFDTNVTYSQFCSAYREVVHVREDVEWKDALVFKPTKRAAGYLWYFPRTGTEINAGVGFQMNEEPMTLVDDLKADLATRPEFEGATVEDKLGAALPTRRPYDSAVAPGFMAVGDAAGHVNPTTGGGIPGAAKAGHWAAQQAVEAIEQDEVSESALWEYNRKVMTDFGKRFAAIDLYNIWGGAHEVDELVSVVSAIPGQQLADAIGKEGTSSMDLGLKLRTLIKSFGHWDLLYELYKVQDRAATLKSHYEAYPSTPVAFEGWRSQRDRVLEEVYEISGAEPKY
ncbi:MAG: geranylgeranyl reductase family protein [Halalkalicoccus sp.]